MGVFDFKIFMSEISSTKARVSEKFFLRQWEANGRISILDGNSFKLVA